MFGSPEEAAVSGVLSMLLEVSANPKSGNVDRGHNFPDMKYEHFLVSASNSFPVFLMAARREKSVGELILESVKNSFKKTGKNVHFGCFLLLIPLLYCWRGDSKEITSNAAEELRRSTVKDSLAVLNAFEISKPRVIDADDLSLKDGHTADILAKNDMNLYKWMQMAPEDNIIAKELVEGYKNSLRGMKLIFDFYDGDINSAIVMTYHTFLSELRDPLVLSKFGEDVVEEIRDKAKLSLSLKNFEELDEEFIKRGINPGTIADITVSSIFLALAEGLRI
ncbi:MAG TPA: triphosphoribosyl-dephospho-CoA synthase [Archaeoglobaceae archaeon]|nr:triphosphoribosyl-dephospho-CoA synthase [Archaeoglobaceae archaeon]